MNPVPAAPPAPVAPAHPDATPHRYSQRPRAWHKRKLDEWAARRFFTRLVKRTNNFDNATWLGHPVWQNVLDLFTIQQTIAEVRPDALIETGTNRAGSALFFAHLFDLMAAGAHADPGARTDGRVLTIDIQRLHAASHPRVTFLLGSAVDEAVLARVRAWLGAIASDPALPPAREGRAPRVMVILDSDHSRAHVRRELAAYAPFVSPGSFLLCQDGVLDTLPLLRKPGYEGPLPAIRDFLAAHPEFEVDHARCERFIVTHHPWGWLRRKA